MLHTIKRRRKVNCNLEYEIAYVKYERHDIESNNSRYATTKTYFECDFKSVIVVIIPYDTTTTNDFDGSVAMFSWGSTYQHKVEEILKEISEKYNESKYSVDSNIINERYYAAKSGLGFIGKNSMFISNKYGPTCYIGLIYVKEELDYANEISNMCGSCSKCISSCPTSALSEFNVDCNKCISESLQNKNRVGDFSHHSNKVYGCDECITCCPYFKKRDTDVLFTGIDLKSTLEISKQDFEKLYKYTSLYWIGYRTFIRNVHIAYINKYQDYSKIEFLNKSNSEYLKRIYKDLRRENE